MNQPADDPTKLNNQLIQLLEGLNNRKSRIDEQVKFLTNLPKILPFEPLPPERSLVSRAIWETWWSEHDQIEKEAGIFREDEFALMKKVAMSKTTNMSREDTDVVGLTLCTLEAFSKLEHLLRSRRKQIQILDLRIRWDQQTSKVWQDLQELESQLPKILSKIRWNPPSQDMDHQIRSAISSPHFNSSSLPGSPSILSSFHPSPSPSSSSRTAPLSRSLPSRKAASDHLSNPDLTPLKARQSHPSGLDTSPLDSSTNPGPSFISSLQSQTVQSTPKSNNPNRFSRMNSLPAFSTTHSPAFGVAPSYSSAQSRAMRIQSLTLHLTSITSNFHTLSRSVALTATTIDQLIDSSLHVPVAFLDMQDKLEAAVRSLQPVETAKFYNALMEQHREADDVWFNLFNLGVEVESYKREISTLLADAQVDQDRLANFERQFDLLSTTYETHHLRTQLQVFPDHPNYPEQSNYNQLLTKNLLEGSEQIRIRLREFNDFIEIYRSATEALKESERLRNSMQECKQALSASIQAIRNLNEQHPQRPWLMNSASCLHPHDKEKEYEIEWNKIMVELKKNLSAGLDLLETTKDGFTDLSSPELDPNIHSELQEIRKGLKELIEQAQQISTSKEKSVKKLSQLRTAWEQILEAQTEMRRLRDQLLLDAHREKWRVRKGSSSSSALPTEELDSVVSPHPRRLRSHQEVQKYLSESLQPVFDTTLAELNKGEEHRVVHQHFLKTFDQVFNVQTPQLARLEQMIQQISLQTSQVRKVESEYDTKVAEGGRWMKKVQGLIGMELEHTYEEFDQSTNLMGLEARQAEKSRSAEALAQLTNYLRGIDSFCDSLSNRIPFITKNSADHLVMQDGREVLNCEAHNQSVRTHLNVLSMNLMGLKDQISNESILLQWICSPNVDEFERAVDNVRNEIKTADAELEKVEAYIQKVQNLIESDLDEQFLTIDQVEQTIDQPLRDLSTSLEQIEDRLSESASVQLGAFVASCPSPSSSQVFKPDQFILPKQMSHHQLQTLYNQTCQRLKDVHTLALKFKGETNLKRKNQLAWREDWTRNIDELTRDCDKLRAETLVVDSEIANLKEDSVDWEINRFRAQERMVLEKLSDQTPDFLNELILQESRLSRSLATLQAFQNKIDLVRQRTVAVKEDIEEKLPAFTHLVTDLVTLADQTRCQWEKSSNIGMQVSDHINQLKESVESFRKELEKREGWKAQCHQITNVQFEAVRQSLIQFDEALAQISNSWCSLDERKSLDETQKTFSSLMSCLKSLNEQKTFGLASIHSNVEAVQKELLINREEILTLSTYEVPHGYLIEAQAELSNQIQGLKNRSQNLENTENQLLDLISRVYHQYESWTTHESENETISKYHEIENGRLSDWSQENLDRFLDSVQTESQKIETFCRTDEPSAPQTPIIDQLQTIESLADAASDMKHQTVKAAGLVISASDLVQRLQILNLSRTELGRQIDFFRRTLPNPCNIFLETILRDPHSDAGINGTNRFEKASSKLQDIESSVASLARFWEECLAWAKENSQLIQDKIHLMNTCSRLCDRLNEVGVDEWIDQEDNSQHSPLPDHNQLEHVLEVLEDTSSEIEKLSNTGTTMNLSCLQDTLNLLEDQKQKSEIMRQLVDFQSATEECDQLFSALLDTLDTRRTDTIGISDLGQSASAALDTLTKVSESIETDPRVKYHLNRSKQTWEELESMMKDRADDRNQGSMSPTCHGKPQSTSALPLRVRTNQHLGNVLNTPPPIVSRRNTFIPRLKHSSDRAIERIESSGIPMGLMDSPSFTASRRHGKITPDPSHSRSKSKIPKSEKLNSKLFPPRCKSREDTRKKEFDSISSTSSTNGFRERPRLHSALGTASSPSALKKSLASAPNSNSTSALYQPQSNRNIDKLVGKVVNRLARNKVRVHVAPAEGWEDNSGMYWIGEKVYFCRILRSQTVMVRIGGGWCELSAFIMEHLRLTTSSRTPQLEFRTAGGSERLGQVDQYQRSLNYPSSKLSRPMGSVVTSSHSSPINTYHASPGALTDSSTTSTPASSITTVLITTPQEIRLSSHPTHSSSHSEHSNHQATPSSFPNNNSFSSTSTTETVQMLFRKAEHRNYLSNNYSPHQHLHPADGMIDDSLVHHHKIDTRTASLSPASAPPKILDPSCLSPLHSNNHLDTSKHQ